MLAVAIFNLPEFKLGIQTFLSLLFEIPELPLAIFEAKVKNSTHLRQVVPCRESVPTAAE
jgi:hypothetical protein